MIQGN